jgi:hypothetical protein
MRIWFGYGSEHSANLVMIGHFGSAVDAAKAVEVIETIKEQVIRERDAGRMDAGEPPSDYGREMLDVLGKVNLSVITPFEFEQFLYDVNVNVEDKDVLVTTEEYDISAFLKILVHRGARVEVYSAHDFDNTGYGRGHRRGSRG